MDALECGMDAGERFWERPSSGWKLRCSSHPIGHPRLDVRPVWRLHTGRKRPDVVVPERARPSGRTRIRSTASRRSAGSSSPAASRACPAAGPPHLPICRAAGSTPRGGTEPHGSNHELVRGVPGELGSARRHHVNTPACQTTSAGGPTGRAGPRPAPSMRNPYRPLTKATAPPLRASDLRGPPATSKPRGGARLYDRRSCDRLAALIASSLRLALVAALAMLSDPVSGAPPLAALVRWARSRPRLAAARSARTERSRVARAANGTAARDPPAQAR